MILLWVLWSKGYVVQSIRQTDAVDEQQLRQPVGARRITGFLLIVAGLVGVLLWQPLDHANNLLAISGGVFAVGILLAWRGKPATAA